MQTPRLAHDDMRRIGQIVARRAPPSMRRPARALLLGAAAALAALTVTAAFGEGYPERPIRIIAAEPGAQSDSMARALAPVLGESLGQAIVVENRPGAGGTISALRAVQSRADGYTLLIGGVNNMVLGPLLRRDLPYTPGRDLVPLGGIARVPYGLAVARHVAAADLRELVAYARAHPGVLAFGSSGVGSSSHLAIALLGARAGLSMLHVPFRGSPVALNELVSGRIDLLACDLALLLPHAKSGAVRLIAVAGPRRADAAPAMPTVAEQGFPGYAVDPWYALYARSGTPQAALDVVARALANAMGEPRIRQQLAAQGHEPFPLTADAVRELMLADTLRFEAALAGIDVQDGPAQRTPTP
jgi:tripartite-type tricarboxylate transporter receptor subunit TctC